MVCLGFKPASQDDRCRRYHGAMAVALSLNLIIIYECVS